MLHKCFGAQKNDEHISQMHKKNSWMSWKFCPTYNCTNVAQMLWCTKKCCTYLWNAQNTPECHGSSALHTIAQMLHRKFLHISLKCINTTEYSALHTTALCQHNCTHGAQMFWYTGKFCTIFWNTQNTTGSSIALCQHNCTSMQVAHRNNVKLTFGRIQISNYCLWQLPRKRGGIALQKEYTS